jgi:hypothetical protein
MKKLFPSVFLALAMACAVPIIETACPNGVTLAAGGAYSDPVLATTDQAILDASSLFSGFLSWDNANATFLARYPEVGTFAASIAANKDAWIKSAYAARDSYAAAVKAYKAGTGSQSDVDAAHAKINGAIALLNNISTQITSYRSAHVIQ